MIGGPERQGDYFGKYENQLQEIHSAITRLDNLSITLFGPVPESVEKEPMVGVAERIYVGLERANNRLRDVTANLERLSGEAMKRAESRPAGTR